MTNSDENSPSRSFNPYQAPKTTIDVPQEGDLVLASRWYRLFARIFDEVLALLISTATMSWWIEEWFASDSEGSFEIFWMPYSGVELVDLLVLFAVYVVLNVYLLATKGQTIGKLIFRIRIVDYYTDEIAKLRFSLAMREGIMFALNFFGFLGLAIGLIDALFIFSSNKRCLHDYWGFTKVVRLPARWEESYSRT